MSDNVVPIRPEPSDVKPKEPSAAQLLVPIAHDLFRFVVADGDIVYGIPHSGGAIAVPLRGTGPNSAGSVRQAISAALYRQHNKVAGQGALADAVALIEAQSISKSRTTVHLRIAGDGGDGAWLDLGRPDGLCAHIGPGAWSLGSPQRGPLFRRTRMIGELPEPVQADDWRAALAELRALVNVTDTSWPLMVGVLLAAITPDIPRPIAYLTGGQGTAKTSAARMLANLVDASPAEPRTTPDNLRDLAITTAAGWVLPLDNVSGISGWLSDALCRIVTGDAYVSRSLYSDDDVSVLCFQRPVLLTSIDAGALRADLADRMAPIELTVIPPARRMSDLRVRRAYRQAHPRILGGLLTLASLTLAALPAARAELTERPRMADFAELLAAMDRVTGWDALPAYLIALTGLAEDVIDGSPVAAALRGFLDEVQAWQGTPAELRTAVSTFAGTAAFERSWPKTAAVFSGQVKRNAPALRAAGYCIEGLDQRGAKGKRHWVLTAPGA